MSDLEDINEKPNERQDVPQEGQPEEQSRPVLPKLLGPISREERGKLFEGYGLVVFRLMNNG